jgi:hypothetical protein
MRFAKQERFYHIYLQHNFFDGITVVCSWGTFDSYRGGYKYIFCDNMQEVDVALQDIKNTRLKRGYKSY